jgi:hypothetical protein
MAQIRRSESVVLNNVRDYDTLRRLMPGRCTNCGYVIETVKCYRIAFLGDVCGLCWSLYTALKGIHLKDSNYFVNWHNAWQASKKPSQDTGGLNGSQA